MRDPSLATLLASLDLPALDPCVTTLYAESHPDHRHHSSSLCPSLTEDTLDRDTDLSTTPLSRLCTSAACFPRTLGRFLALTELPALSYLAASTADSSPLHSLPPTPLVSTPWLVAAVERASSLFAARHDSFMTTLHAAPSSSRLPLLSLPLLAAALASPPERTRSWIGRLRPLLYTLTPEEVLLSTRPSVLTPSRRLWERTSSFWTLLSSSPSVLAAFALPLVPSQAALLSSFCLLTTPSFALYSLPALLPPAITTPFKDTAPLSSLSPPTLEILAGIYSPLSPLSLRDALDAALTLS